MYETLPGSGSFQGSMGCLPAVLIVLLYAGSVIVGLWCLYRWVWP